MRIAGEAGGFEDGVEAAFFVFPGRVLGAVGFLVDQPGGLAGFNIAARGEAGEGWQIVRGGRNDGVRGIFLRPAKIARPIALKPKKPIAEDSCCRPATGGPRR